MDLTIFLTSCSRPIYVTLTGAVKFAQTILLIYSASIFLPFFLWNLLTKFARLSQYFIVVQITVTVF
jgi:hypothetical protein